MLATSIGGGFVAIAMLGCMIGNYPNPIVVSAQIKSGQIDSFPWEVYLYFALSLLMSVCGFVVQCKMWKDKKDEKKEGKDIYENLNKMGY